MSVRTYTFTDKDGLNSLLSLVEAVLATESEQPYFASASHSIYQLKPETDTDWGEWVAHIVVFMRRDAAA